MTVEHRDYEDSGSKRVIMTHCPFCEEEVPENPRGERQSARHIRNCPEAE